MRYQGTDIDGVFLDPERLEVRGTDLLAIAESCSYGEAVAHILTGCGRSDAVAKAVGAIMLDALASIHSDAPPVRLVLAARDAGASPCEAVIAGLMAREQAAPSDAAVRSLPDAQIGEGLAQIAVLPVYLAAAAAPDPTEARAAIVRCNVFAQANDATYVGALHRLFVAAPTPAQTALLERVLTIWHGGFGYLPPSIMMPRIAIGTGVPLRIALAAGFAAGGPFHIGACEHSTRLLATIMAKAAGDGLEAAAESVVAGALAQAGRLPGFGHPLFVADPRPPFLRRAAGEFMPASPALAAYDATVAEVKRRAPQLNPNIDCASAALFLASGVRMPEAAAGLSLCARAAAMLAHAIERRRKPAFGVTSAVARRHLSEVPDWL